jgi:hypothetical protein
MRKPPFRILQEDDIGGPPAPPYPRGWAWRIPQKVRYLLRELQRVLPQRLPVDLPLHDAACAIVWATWRDRLA